MKLREEEFYEQYHQHGGTTIIPTEIFNELYDDATEEIERLNKESEQLRTALNSKESTIREVREYIEKHTIMFKNGDILVDMNVDELLEILDKENNNE